MGIWHRDHSWTHLGTGCLSLQHIGELGAPCLMAGPGRRVTVETWSIAMIILAYSCWWQGDSG
jgi:hypothetical protein